MTTFTTEDRILAEKNGSVTINVEPIPFAGLITITESAPANKDLYLYLSKDQNIDFTAEFEMLTGEQRLAVLNRTMDLIMAKTGQVIDSLEVQ
jgi:hypothetical protein